MSFKNNLCSNLRARELGHMSCHQFKTSQQVTISLVKRLGLQKELEFHRGCVNCLEWNESGLLLASGSDDCNIGLWDPFTYRLKSQIMTGHEGNIFSVKFLPKTGDQTLVTGAADNQIRVHDVERGHVMRVYTAHFSRVKRLAIAPGVPNLFWSASEDGTIRQFDLRDSSSLASNPANVLINLNAHLGPQAEAKCLAVNPRYPHLLAVGANDPYVRVFDRRKLVLQTVSLPAGANGSSAAEGSPSSRMGLLHNLANEMKAEIEPSAVQYYVPGHLPQRLEEYHRRFRSLAVTYLTYSPDGVDLIVNLGGEQVYLFNTHNMRPAYRYDPPPPEAPEPNGNSESNSDNAASPNNGDGPTRQRAQKRPKRSKYEGRPLPRAIEEMKLRANQHFEKRNFSSAISFYNEAIARAPDYAVLYGNRAAALMKRNWDGDLYSALMDCQRAVGLDVTHVKAHYRMARCLYELNRFREARDCLRQFFQRFPNFRCNPSCEQLNTEINESLAKEEKNASRNGDDAPSNGSTRTSGHGPPDLFCHSPQEQQWRRSAHDFTSRYLGHCNTTTDIKEANFFGSDGQFIVAGSDDGSFFIWDRNTTNIVRILRGDESIVNCLQPHPDLCLLATSGIDPVVRLWSPMPEDRPNEEREVLDRHVAASANQRRMNSDPINMMLMQMGYRLGYEVGSRGEEEYVIARASTGGTEDDDDDDDDDEDDEDDEDDDDEEEAESSSIGDRGHSVATSRERSVGRTVEAMDVEDEEEERTRTPSLYMLPSEEEGDDDTVHQCHTS